MASRQKIIDRPDVAAALLQCGGRLIRHSFVMSLDLSKVTFPADTGGTELFELAPMSLDRTQIYGGILCRAYPKGHPDHDSFHPHCDAMAAAASIVEDLHGNTAGEWLEWTSFELQTVNSGMEEVRRTVGAIIVTNLPPMDTYPSGGPWIAEIFLEPTFAGRGCGTRMIKAAVNSLLECGHSSVGLIVSAENPARNLYLRFGFVNQHETWLIEVPPGVESA